MKAIKTEIEGVYILEPTVFRDERGYFYESFSQRDFQRLTDLDVEFVQDNQALSSRGVLRGLHFQKGSHAQAKLVRVIEGTVLDVAVDIRKGSATFGKHIAVELSGENMRQLFIPRGFAHGYLVLSPNALFQYKTDNYYCPESEGGIIWNDAALDIDWRLAHDELILSPKDMALPKLIDSAVD